MEVGALLTFQMKVSMDKSNRFGLTKVDSQIRNSFCWRIALKDNDKFLFFSSFSL